ncbi:MAG: hypothetical protein US02_C0022G0003 [Candidatus Levybacteria bacterium GW2011_GWA2_36_13]|nr:MAG: hypothetical protein US02_C0022G0003 [Candidatus Levybacteria bacterium GW2011_GWA2_36_13]KKP99104.1 MAG: hypothetical protein US07_C0024G0005 [Candidatus Levybacteria bacterium GW2011_GWB1_36_18]KKR14524.1 MAG: hypothetical protein UT44_C0058G0003 [Candidatus Levybacteria bacterium GW2011_GWA1_39_32]OGH43784.1 MAG: hypothetical protein A3I49_01005 [Candidatus Levybacteria bacterium RIFCSPLOWO2_02_FULL_37_11]
MRKIFPLALIVLFLFSLVTTGRSFAKEDNILSPSPTPITKIEYQLPYPGLLPGSPLYPLKKLRDKIIEVLTTDPLKKAEFYLLQSDKNLETGVMLVNRGDGKTAESTISKGENYFEQAISKIISAKEEQANVDEVLGRMQLSSMKHQEVIKDLMNKTKGEIKSGLRKSLKRSQDFEKRLDELSPKK